MKRSSVSLLFQYDVEGADGIGARMMQLVDLATDGSPTLTRPFVQYGLVQGSPELFEGRIGTVAIEREPLSTGVHLEPAGELLSDRHWFEYLGQLHRAGQLEPVFRMVYEGDGFAQAIARQALDAFHLRGLVGEATGVECWALVPAAQGVGTARPVLVTDMRILDDRFEDGREEPPPFVLDRYRHGVIVESAPVGPAAWNTEDGDDSVATCLRVLAASVSAGEQSLVDAVRTLEETLGEVDRPSP
ncbi:MAG: hypothetical protein EPN79_16115 [Burkholderiaceae bacterium]|nr:MAG: hypothetical protein EPN79_16115 [Burkholderiaceae bacterium]